MPTEALAAPALRPLRVSYSRAVDVCVAFFVFCGAIALVEPSPYDFASFVAIPLWFFGGFRVGRGLLVFLALIIVYNLAGFASLALYWNEPEPRLFMLQSLYLAITAAFFAIYFNEATERRTERVLYAFAASTVVAALAGIAGYFDLFNTGETFATYGRAAGTFKDPNVLGSYLILGALAYLQALMLGRTRHVFLHALALIVVLGGILLSFSRGSWGAFVLAAALMVTLTFATTRDPRLRRRIVIGAMLAFFAALILIGIALSIDAIRELLVQRAQAVGEEYNDLRFDNQWRSLPMLLDLPNGFGPLRFRLFFGLEPHSSYVNAFASYGWAGGFAFLALVGATVFIGFRLVIVRSPFRRMAQIYWPALLVFLLQGFQIDIDHWRHVWLMFGAVWGMEAARQRWQHAQDATPLRLAPPKRLTGQRWLASDGAT